MNSKMGQTLKSIGKCFYNPSGEGLFKSDVNLGGSAVKHGTLDFGSDHGLKVVRSSPENSLLGDGEGSTLRRESASLLLPLPLHELAYSL